MFHVFLHAISLCIFMSVHIVDVSLFFVLFVHVFPYLTMLRFPLILKIVVQDLLGNMCFKVICFIF